MSDPLVSVRTPVFNGETYLSKCIESVIRQTHSNWEYVIIDNCSTDRTLEIAESYARKDKRIKVRTNKTFVSLIENHNVAFRSVSPESQYCKIVSADDWIFPRALEEMLQVGERHSSIGIIGSYQLSCSRREGRVVWDGLPYPSELVDGREVCRWHLLGSPYVFGTPTSILYRTELAIKTDSFFPNSRLHADTSACYESLKSWDFGFVHQVLSFERVHDAAASTVFREEHSYLPGILVDLVTYGPYFLTEAELKSRVSAVRSEYYRFLARSALRRNDQEFWRFHRDTLHTVGNKIASGHMAQAMVEEFLHLILNPGNTINRLRRFRKSKANTNRDSHESTGD